MLVDTQTIQQVLGSLMQHPQYLSEVDKYSLTPLDFNSRLEKYIFQAIQGLYQNGAEVIQPIDIENAIAEDPAARETFEKENDEIKSEMTTFANVKQRKIMRVFTFIIINL